MRRCAAATASLQPAPGRRPQPSRGAEQPSHAPRGPFAAAMAAPAPSRPRSALAFKSRPLGLPRLAPARSPPPAGLPHPLRAAPPPRETGREGEEGVGGQGWAGERAWGIRWQANWAVFWAARPISRKNTEIHKIFSVFSFLLNIHTCIHYIYLIFFKNNEYSVEYP